MRYLTGINSLAIVAVVGYLAFPSIMAAFNAAPNVAELESADKRAYITAELQRMAKSYKANHCNIAFIDDESGSIVCNRVVGNFGTNVLVSANLGGWIIYERKTWTDEPGQTKGKAIAPKQEINIPFSLVKFRCTGSGPCMYDDIETEELEAS